MKKIVFTLLPALFLATSVFAQNPERHPIYEPSGKEGAAAPQSKNLFLNAKVTASGVYGDDKAELAVDGRLDKNKYWGSENAPVWLQVDMGKVQQLSSIRFWPYWADGRVYKFKIEGSTDAEKWNLLVDQSANSITGTEDGFQYSFTPAQLRYVKVTILDNSKGKANGGHIVEIQGFSEAVSSQLQARAASADLKIKKNVFPAAGDTVDSVTATAWGGERVNGKVVLWGESLLSQVRFSSKPLTGPGGRKIPVNVSFLRYTQARGELFADIIDEAKTVEIPAGTVRSLWVSANVPINTPPGLYSGSVTAYAQGSQAVEIPIKVTVLPASIAEPKNWAIHVDLWQHPEAVARWHDVPSWSPEHLALMKPLMKRLADAGQKAITCSLIDEAWNGQTYDWWPAMIEWVKGADGKMRYDYTNFDKYVSMMMGIGIKDQISCYTMLPWSLKLRYLDEVSGEYKVLDLKPGEKSFEDIWGPFLTDFRNHVKSKGWLNITCIGIDERPDRMVKAASEVVRKYAPEFKIVSAVNHPSAMSNMVYDMSPGIQYSNSVTPEILEARKKAGQKTTFYVCTSPAVPNTFTHSPLAESEWMGIFAAARNLDGFLRWAYNSWNRDPFEKTDFGNWPAGDCWLVYPGNRSSVRFERLRDGFEDFEKITLLRKKLKNSKSPAYKKAMEELEKELAERFTVEKSKGKNHAEDIQVINELITKAVLAK